MTGRRPVAIVPLAALALVVSGCGAGGDDGAGADGVPEPADAADVLPDPVTARDDLAEQLERTLTAVAPLRFTEEAGATESECSTPEGTAGTQWLLPEYVAATVPDPAGLLTQVQAVWEEAGHVVERDEMAGVTTLEAGLLPGTLTLNVGGPGAGATLSGATDCRGPDSAG